MLTMTTYEPLTKRQAAILNALHSGDWMNRQELAEATGKRNLSPNDRNHLETLERRGLIKISKRAIDGPQGFEFIYRIK